MKTNLEKGEIQLVGGCVVINGVVESDQVSDGLRECWKKPPAFANATADKPAVPCLLKRLRVGRSPFCRAHVLRVCSARQAYSAEVSYEGREGLRLGALGLGGSDNGLF